jgi:hypothetical protein
MNFQVHFWQLFSTLGNEYKGATNEGYGCEFLLSRSDQREVFHLLPNWATRLDELTMTNNVLR